MKKSFTLLCFSLCQTLLSAQGSPGINCDTIVLNNGQTILAEIDHSTDSEIFYTKCGDSGASQRAIGKSFVKEIRSKRGVKAVTGGPSKPMIDTDSTQLWHIITKDGNDYIGTITSQDAEKIVLRTTSLGDISIPKNQIRVLEPIKKTQIVGGEFWYESPHATRYFWAPNAYGLKAGEGYYQNTWIFLNQASYGITNNFSIGAGIIPAFLFGASGFPFWITPKITIPVQKDEINLGAGVLYVNAVGDDFEGISGTGIGIAYGALTSGPRDRNVTLGLGYGFANGNWARYPTITFCGMFRTSKKFMFLTENYLITIGEVGTLVGILSAGGRYGGKGIAIDFGLFRPVGEDTGSRFWALPWLGLNVPFGKAKY